MEELELHKRYEELYHKKPGNKKPETIQKLIEDKEAEVSGPVDVSPVHDAVKKDGVANYFCKEGYEPHLDEMGSVHFYLTNFNVPRPEDHINDTEWRPPRVLHKMLPENFVNTFKSNFTFNNAFEAKNVNTPAVIYSILKNMDRELFKERYDSVVEGWGKTIRGKKLSQKIDAAFEKSKTLVVNGHFALNSGGRQEIKSIEDIVFVPPIGQENVNKVISKLPSDV